MAAVVMAGWQSCKLDSIARSVCDGTFDQKELDGIIENAKTRSLL